MFRDLVIFLIIIVAGWLAIGFRDNIRKTRSAFIRDYAFPTGLFDKLAKKYPHLTEADRQQVGRALKQFFMAYAHTRQFVSMPSQAADELWHEFILYTRAYEAFCRQAFGRFMHHTPAVVLGTGQQNNQGLHRMWHDACRQEEIDPAKPPRLPLLFALDAMLRIPGGYLYHPQCESLAKSATAGGTVHCAGEFGGSSSCSGGSDGGNDSNGSHGSDSSDGGGDSGCGGGGSGCGGGGD
jgi:hypothetical protein